MSIVCDDCGGAFSCQPECVRMPNHQLVQQLKGEKESNDKS